MVTYSEITTALTGSWNGAIIAEPSYFKLARKKPTRYGLYIKITPSKLRVVGPGGGADIATTTFLIKVIAKSRADMDKFVQEIKRIINTKSVSGGHWRITSTDDLAEQAPRYEMVLFGEEKIWLVNNQW